MLKVLKVFKVGVNSVNGGHQEYQEYQGHARLVQQDQDGQKSFINNNRQNVTLDRGPNLFLIPISGLLQSKA